MRRSNWTPSIVPSDDQTFYLVADDFGPIGRAWREADLETGDLETVIQDLLSIVIYLLAVAVLLT